MTESASRDLDFLVTSQGPIAFLVQATKTFFKKLLIVHNSLVKNKQLSLKNLP